MNFLFEAAEEIKNFSNSNNWEFCFIGGLAVIRWGEIRMTQDVDLTISCVFGEEENYIDSLLSSFAPRIDNVKKFAIENRVLLLKSSKGIDLDISFGGMPFEMEMIKRASAFDFDTSFSLKTCSAEDLIILKAFAARDKDWGDIRGVISRNNSLDRSLIINQLKPLVDLKNEPEIIEKLNSIFEQA